VDATGCPILFEEEQTTVVLRGVTFATGSAALTQNARTILDEVAQTLVANAAIRVEIGGHTDATGSRALNVRLSQSRADAVRAYLVQRGVAMPRLTTRGYGPDNPIATNATAAGRAQNRRVELRRLN
jgi:OOP family OmpA-OmpF porin